MAQAKADLELVLEAEFALSPRREVVSPVSPSSGVRIEVYGSDESEIVVTLDPAFLRTPQIVPDGPSVHFDESSEASLAVGDEAPIPKVVATSFASAAALPISKETTHVLPSIFSEFPSIGSMGADFSGGKIFIPSSPFSTSPMGGQVPSPSFPPISLSPKFLYLGLVKPRAMLPVLLLLLGLIFSRLLPPLAKVSRCHAARARWVGLFLIPGDPLTCWLHVGLQVLDWGHLSLPYADFGGRPSRTWYIGSGRFFLQ